MITAFLWYFVYRKFRKSKLRAPVILQVLFHNPSVENKLIFFYNKFTPASNNKAKMLNDES